MDVHRDEGTSCLVRTDPDATLARVQKPLLFTAKQTGGPTEHVTHSERLRGPGAEPGLTLGVLTTNHGVVHPTMPRLTRFSISFSVQRTLSGNHATLIEDERCGIQPVRVPTMILTSG